MICNHVGMKNLTVYFVLAIMMSIGLGACVSLRSNSTAGNSGKIPPGQAKKIFGTKSAKPFAPGQRKKMKSY